MTAETQPLPERIEPQWSAESDWRAENDAAGSFTHGVLDLGDGLAIIIADTAYFYGPGEKRIRQLRDELCAAWNRRAPAGAGWRDISSAPRDGTVVSVPGGIAHYHNDAWHSLTGFEWPGKAIQWPVTAWQPLPAPPGATPAAPPAPDAALREALESCANMLDDAAAVVASQGLHETSDSYRREAKTARAALAEADAGRARG